MQKRNYRIFKEEEIMYEQRKQPVTLCQWRHQPCGTGSLVRRLSALFSLYCSSRVLPSGDPRLSRR